MKDLNICIAGLGNVGANLISTIQNNSSFIKSKNSLSINIIAVSARTREKKRICDISLYKWCSNPLDFLSINNCNIIIELIGNEKGVSYELVKKALENKALLAKYGSELFGITEKNNVLLLFEAAVAGGIPIIKTIKNNIFLNKVNKISGILNGTTNYILTTMKEKNISFDDALLMAQKKGFTSKSEAELDIGGLDSAHKLTLLTTLCFGSKVNFANNDINGIYDIKIDDILNAERLGYKIKLISESYIIDGNVTCITGPKLIKKSNPLSNVDGVLNAIKIETDQLDSLFLEGEGAGGKATASSVISDLYEISSNSNISSIGYLTKDLVEFKKLDIFEIEKPYYLRIMTKDIAGVLSKITGYFNELDISIEKILQLPEPSNKNLPIPIIISTHAIKKNILIDAIKKIETQDFVLEKVTFIPIDNK